MVRAKATRPRRRNPGAGPSRGRVAAPVGTARSEAERYPTMNEVRRMDREEHVRRARAMGATRKQAARHADSEIGGH